MKVYRVIHNQTVPFTVDELNVDHPSCTMVSTKISFETIFYAKTDKAATRAAKNFEEDVPHNSVWNTELTRGQFMADNVFLPNVTVYQNSSGIARMA